jgi:hypothetical protein
VKNNTTKGIRTLQVIYSLYIFLIAAIFLGFLLNGGEGYKSGLFNMVFTEFIFFIVTIIIQYIVYSKLNPAWVFKDEN